MPVTIATVAERSGVHQNTAREHLRSPGETRAGGPNPANKPWPGPAEPGCMQPLSTTSSQTNVSAITPAWPLHWLRTCRTSNDPVTEAVQAGRVWGRELVAETPVAASPATATKARRRVVELLRDLGFDPVADQSARSVTLRRCPLRDAAKRYPQVVCQVHLGIVRGAMDALGGDPERRDHAVRRAWRLSARNYGPRSQPGRRFGGIRAGWAAFGQDGFRCASPRSIGRRRRRVLPGRGGGRER